MYRGERVAVYTGTRNLYKWMVAAVKSMLMHTDVDKIYLFIEDDEFPYELPSQVITRNVSNQKYFPADGPNMRSRFTYMALIRAALCKEFPELDRILSLDVDTIVVEDIGDIWDLELGDEYYFSAVPEPHRVKQEGYLYTNVGVTLFNLKKLRDGKADEVINAINTVERLYVDQDILNELCHDNILPMPAEYNGSNFTYFGSKPKIVHYAAMRYWGDVELVQKYLNTPWNDIEKYRKRNGMPSLEMKPDEERIAEIAKLYIHKFGKIDGIKDWEYDFLTGKQTRIQNKPSYREVTIDESESGKRNGKPESEGEIRKPILDQPV